MVSYICHIYQYYTVTGSQNWVFGQADVSTDGVLGAAITAFEDHCHWATCDDDEAASRSEDPDRKDSAIKTRRTARFSRTLRHLLDVTGSICSADVIGPTLSRKIGERSVTSR